MIKIEKDGLIENYNVLEESKTEFLPEEVWIWDETLRDGEQTPGVFLTIDEKIELAKLMDEMGVAVIAAGFPAVSQSEKDTIKKISSENLSLSVAAPARAMRSDIDACLDCEVDEVPIFIASSDLHLKYKLRMSKEEVMEAVSDSISYAKNHGVVVDFITEDSSRTQIDFLIELHKVAIEAGVDKICACDTVGFLRPLSMKYLMRRIREEVLKVRKVPLAVHCHDDFGLATSNTLAGIEEGVTYPLTCINGYGERAGNAPLEEVVMALEVLYGINTHIKTEKLYELSTLTEKYFTVPMPVHKAIVGENAFSHESGIHIHGEMEHHRAYEPISPSSIGRERRFFLGKFTGAHAIRHELEKKGIDATDEEVAIIVDRIKDLQERIGKDDMRRAFNDVKRIMSEMHKGVTEEELWKITKEITGKDI
ncbi:MAG: homoaconitate hydratase [Halobacteriota archaeon]|nr:homoaconitate hydratase [Halobacteriota archaeon]